MIAYRRRFLFARSGWCGSPRFPRQVRAGAGGGGTAKAPLPQRSPCRSRRSNRHARGIRGALKNEAIPALKKAGGMEMDPANVVAGQDLSESASSPSRISRNTTAVAAHTGLRRRCPLQRQDADDDRHERNVRRYGRAQLSIRSNSDSTCAPAGNAPDRPRQGCDFAKAWRPSTSRPTGNLASKTTGSTPGRSAASRHGRICPPAGDVGRDRQGPAVDTAIGAEAAAPINARRAALRRPSIVYYRGLPGSASACPHQRNNADGFSRSHRSGRVGARIRA
jgi:hypothetical protein